MPSHREEYSPRGRHERHHQFRDGTSALKHFMGEDGQGDAGAGRSSLVLLDLNLPDMTGIDILAILKGNEHTRRAP